MSCEVTNWLTGTTSGRRIPTATSEALSPTAEGSAAAGGGRACLGPDTSAPPRQPGTTTRSSGAAGNMSTAQPSGRGGCRDDGRLRHGSGRARARRLRDRVSRVATPRGGGRCRGPVPVGHALPPGPGSPRRPNRGWALVSRGGGAGSPDGGVLPGLHVFPRTGRLEGEGFGASVGVVQSRRRARRWAAWTGRPCRTAGRRPVCVRAR